MRIYIIRVGHDLRRHSPPAIPTLRNIATAKMLPGWSNIPNVQNKSRNGRWSILTHGTLQNTLPRQFTDMACNVRLGLANACHLSKPPPRQIIPKNCTIKLKRASAFAHTAIPDICAGAHTNPCLPPTPTPRCFLSVGSGIATYSSSCYTLCTPAHLTAIHLHTL